MQKQWKWGECVNIGQKIQFTSNAAKEWLIYVGQNPNGIFEVIDISETGPTHRVVLKEIDSDKNPFIISSGSSVSEGGILLP